jgi:hypothetical protein
MHIDARRRDVGLNDGEETEALEGVSINIGFLPRKRGRSDRITLILTHN